MAVDTTSILATASTGAALTIGGTIEAIAGGTDPTVAILTLALSSVPNPWYVLAGFIFWKFWLKDYLAKMHMIADQRSALLIKLDVGQDNVDSFMRRMDDTMARQENQHLQMVERNVQYMKTHTETIPRLESKINCIASKLGGD